MKLWDLIIIGTGPSGLFCGYNTALSGKSTLILEKNLQFGKKLLIAGQGKCNLTHSGDTKSFLTKFGDNGKFLKQSLNNFNPQNLKDWFESLGLPLVLLEETGKYFPNTMSSQDVLKVMIDSCKKAGVIFKNNTCVLSTTKINEKNEDATLNSGYFKVITTNDNEVFYAQNIVIATGGMTYPQTGTTGDGYKFAKKLGHSIVTPSPCLTPIFVDNYSFAEISGISVAKVKIGLFRENILIKENRGDILFTHHNLSGPGIIDFSRYVKKNDILKINFVNMEPNEFFLLFQNYSNLNGAHSIKTFLYSLLLPKRLIQKILFIHKLDENRKIAEINKSERKIILSLSDYPFTVIRVGDVNIAMATSGGVCLQEINPKTMESKLCKNLYFVGEVLDIDGDTGGYNIQAGFSTGYTASLNISKIKNS